EQQTAVRLECARDDVCGIRVSSSIRGWSDAAFRVGLDDQASQVWYCSIDFVYFGFPPCDHCGIERIERFQSAHRLRTSEIDREGDAHAPGTKLGGDARDLGQKIGSDHARISVDIVDGASVDAQGSEHSGVVADAGQVGAGVLVVPKYG